MAALLRKTATLGALGTGVLAVSLSAAVGTGPAGASPNDPGMDTVSGHGGEVSSRQADSTSGSKHCLVGTGTLGTASTHHPEMGVPKQTAAEAGPSWVGSDGWAAIGRSRSNPWGGNFGGLGTTTGPQCKQGVASKGNSF